MVYCDKCGEMYDPFKNGLTDKDRLKLCLKCWEEVFPSHFQETK